MAGKCVYTDGFENFLRKEIQTADVLIYAFTIRDHFTESTFKCYDDRQFCNGHRTVTRGTPAGYLISGDYRYEKNLQTIVEARCEVGATTSAALPTDEGDAAAEIQALADNLGFAMERSPPARPISTGRGHEDFP